MRSRVLALLNLALLSIAAGYDGFYPDVSRFAPAQKRKLFAVLVDAENSSWRKMEPILEEIAKFGDTTVRRVYGDFTMASLAEWRRVSLELSFLPISTMCHIPGKGSSDAALIIQAMDLLHTNPTLDGFALVSSDSDFTSLAQRLREAGKDVLGFGQKKKTPKPFVISCAQFIYTENLDGGTDTDNLAGVIDTDTPTCAAPAIGVRPHPSTRRLSTEATELLTRAVQQLADEADGQGWVNLSLVKVLLTQFKPDFDVRSYGFKTLKAGVLSEPRQFEGKTTLGNQYCIRLVGDSSEAGALQPERGRGANTYLAAAEEMPVWNVTEAIEKIGRELKLNAEWEEEERRQGTAGGIGSAGKLSTDAIELLTRAVKQATDEGGDEGGWVDLGQIKVLLVKFKPEFDLRSYGFPNMKAMMLSEPRLFEGVSRYWSDTGVSRGYWIRLVGGSSDATAE